MEFMTSYDRNNVPLYEKGENSKYLCSMCGQYTTLDDSVSHKGYNLICNRCEWKIRHIMGLEASPVVLQAVQKKGALTESLMNNIKKDGECNVKEGEKWVNLAEELIPIMDEEEGEADV